MSTAELVARASAVRFDALPQSLILQMKRSIADTICLAIGAYGKPFSRVVMAYADAQAGPAHATLWGSTMRTGTAAAAFVNGALAHCLDFDDHLKPMSAHPSPPILPALTALAESRALSGKAFLEAYAAGLEVAARVGELLNMGHMRRGWHPTSVLGTIASAAACAKALQLDAAGTTGAIGIAASFAGGMRAAFGTPVKGLHAGNAARNGVDAALLAEAGCGSYPDILERESGFYRLFSGDGNGPNDAPGREGIVATIMHYGLGWKRHPFCARVAPAVDAMLWLRRTHGFSGKDVDRIRCGASEIALHVMRFHRPTCGFQAQYSMHYCLAAAAEYGDVSLVHMRDENMSDPALAALMDRIDFVRDDDLPLRGLQETEAYPTRITVTLRDGRKLEVLAFRRVGSGSTLVVDGREIPLPTTETELQDKWRGCLAIAGCGAAALDPLLAAVNDVERAPNLGRLIGAIPRAQNTCGGR